MASSQASTMRNLGIEISHSKIIAAVVEGGSNVTHTSKATLSADDDAMARLAEIIGELSKSLGGIDRVAVAVPGLVDRRVGKVAYSANIPGHANVEFVAELKRSTGLDVCLENDANAAAFAEFRLGAGRGSKDMFYATLGDGVGGALIFNGEIWRGAAGFAGEFGYMAIDAEGMRLEEVASASNIIRRTKSRFKQDSTSSLNRLDEENISLEVLVAAAQNEDDFARMMLERTGNYVGTAIASVINLLNVEKVVIGGSIMEADELVLNAVIGRAKELSFKPSFDSTSIVEGELGENAAAIGAALICGY